MEREIGTKQRDGSNAQLSVDELLKTVSLPSCSWPKASNAESFRGLKIHLIHARALSAWTRCDDLSAPVMIYDLVDRSSDWRRVF